MNNTYKTAKIAFLLSNTRKSSTLSNFWNPEITELGCRDCNH